MELLDLHCKHCGASIQQEDIVWDRKLARCSYCGTVFSLLDVSSDRLTPPAAVPERQDRAPVAMPKNMTMLDMGDILQISYKWFGPKFIFLIIFCAFWDGFMIFWHGMALASGAWFMSLFGLLHTFVGVGLTYYTLAGLFNTTTLQTSQGVIGIWHHPLPWWGNKQVLAHDITQLYTTEKIHHSKNGTSYSYELNALLGSGAKEKLLQGMNEAEQALYIEQELERYLGITDRPVRGEFPRS